MGSQNFDNGNAPQGRALAVLALIAAAVALMAVPAVIGALSLFDQQALDGTTSWLPAISKIYQYIDGAQLAVAIALAATVSAAKAES